MRVDIIDWKLIGACNLRCLHCYGPPKSERALPLEQLLDVISRFEDINPRWVVLTGGEPLIVPHIDLVMRRLKAAGIRIALSTNSSFFPSPPSGHRGMRCVAQYPTRRINPQDSRRVASRRIVVPHVFRRPWALPRPSGTETRDSPRGHRLFASDPRRFPGHGASA